MLALRETITAFRRTPLLSVLSITTIAFSLFAFGLFGLVALNIRTALTQLEERVEIRAFLSESAPVEAVAAAMGDIGSFPEVAMVVYVTPEQALERARRELAEFKDVLEAETGVLPGSIEVRLRPNAREPASVSAVADRIGSYDFVDDVRFGEEWVEKLYRVRTGATVVGLILGAAFATVAIIIIGATIRMAVLARGREIAIMRLVGATDGFIRLPFLLEGLAKGILGGLLALLLTWIANGIVDRNFIDTEFFDRSTAMLGVFAGALIGLFGSAFSVGRHLRRV
jgi:cell division transport system permease protein